MTKPNSACMNSMMMLRSRWMFAGLLAMGLAVGAQAQATGNGTATEPSFPTTVCSSVTATVSIVNGEPSSELNAANDTTNIQNALSACASGSAVELKLGSGGNDAFVIKPIYIPGGVTLIVDAGVTVFGSLNAADYQVSGVTTQQCGVIYSGTAKACYPLITLGQSSLGGQSAKTGAGLMGYGVIDGRGGDVPVIVNSGGTNINNTCTGGTACSWWQLADNARSGGNQNNPILVSVYKGVSAKIYKITLINSPMFHVKFSSDGTQTNNFMVWGAKVLTPFSARNTDGIDPGGANGVWIESSVISDGDDEIAVSGSSATSNYSLENLTLTSGHGISIGSGTISGVSNILVNNVNFNGRPTDGNDEGLRIKSYCSNGGTVNNVTYQNVCMQNVTTAIDLNSNYSSDGSGTASCPLYTNILFQNIHVLSGTSSNVVAHFMGLSNEQDTISFNNLVFDQLTSVTSAGVPQYTTITNAGPVYPAALATLNTAGGTGVSYTPSAPTVSNASAYSCPASNFPTLVGELAASTTVSGTTTNNLNKAFSATTPTTISLNAMVEPTVSQKTYASSGGGTYTGAAKPSGTVQFYDSYNGGTVTAIGSPVSLTQNGTLATYTVGDPLAGTHVYSAQYANDSNYANLSFGSLTVTVNAGPAAQLAYAAAPASALVYGNGPGTVSVAVQDAAGDTITSSSAPVTLTVTGPSSYKATYGPVTASSGVATFSSVVNPPMVGSYIYTATSGVLTSAGANESVSSAQLQVNATTASRVFGQPNPNFVYAIAGYVNGDGSNVVTGMPVLSTAALRNSPAGNYTIVETQGTLAATNYVFLENGNTLTVNGGAVQVVNFYPLPSFASNASYQLSATASSGLPVTYSVSGTGASISGSTLTLAGSASGQTITVTATQAGNASYAAATSVAQSFVAR